MTRLLALIIVADLTTAALSGCGKKNKPRSPDKDSTYPQQYPKPR